MLVYACTALICSSLECLTEDLYIVTELRNQLQQIQAYVCLICYVCCQYQLSFIMNNCPAVFTKMQDNNNSYYTYTYTYTYTNTHHTYTIYMPWAGKQVLGLLHTKHILYKLMTKCVIMCITQCNIELLNSQTVGPSAIVFKAFCTSLKCGKYKRPSGICLVARYCQIHIINHTIERNIIILIIC